MKINLYILLVVGLAQGSFLNCMDAGSANVQALSEGAPVVSAQPDSLNNTKELEQQKAAYLMEIIQEYVDCGTPNLKQQIIEALRAGVNLNLKLKISADKQFSGISEISCHDLLGAMNQSHQVLQMLQTVLDQTPQLLISQMVSQMGFNSVDEMKAQIAEAQKRLENGSADRIVELQELFAHYENKEFGEQDSDDEILDSVLDTLDDESDSSAAAVDKRDAVRSEKGLPNPKKESAKKSGWFSWLTPKRVALVGVTAVAAYVAKNYFFPGEAKKNK